MPDILTRDQLKPEHKWRLEDIFATDEAWEQTYADLKGRNSELAAFVGKLNNADTIKQALDLEAELSLLMEKLFVYARMRRDENNAAAKYQAMTDRATMLGVELSEQSSYIVPEMTRLDAAILADIANKPELSLHKRGITEIVRNKPHILTEAEERLLALSGDMAGNCDKIFDMLNDADIKFPTIKDENGQDVEITHARYRALLESRDRRVRREAFEGVYSTYKALLNTLNASYSGNVKTDIFYTRARRFPSNLERSLFADNVPIAVYETLINTIHANFPTMHRYVALRKELLKLDEMHMYDMYTPIVSDIDYKLSYDEAKQLVKESLAPLGTEYAQLLDEAFSGGWVDVYETRGKTSGAYSWGVYGTHPYVLLNFTDDLDNTFTLAHELGHAMHSYFSNRTQPYTTAHYKIFVAEVASTVNEILLLKHLLDKTQDKQMRAYLLNHYLEQFRTTVFRQVMFAEFERDTHGFMEAGQPLTQESMSEHYLKLNQAYYGPSVISDEQISWEWSRIPHFYNAFYVYKYATGFSAAVAIVKMLREQGDKELQKYLTFLSAGGSDDPIEILKLAGVDLSTPKPVEQCMSEFSLALDEFTKLMWG